METSSKHFRLFLAVLMICLVLPASIASAQGNGNGNGNGNGGGNSDLSEYDFIDLLGFDNGNLGYQSRGYFILDRDQAGETQIYGSSYNRVQSQPSLLSPAIWFIDANGGFPSDNPMDQGLPPYSLELEPTGFNYFGIGDCRNRRASQQDGQGNWIFPGCADVPGVGYAELPGNLYRDTTPTAINDAGVIVGIFEKPANNPNNPEDRNGAGGLWQLLPNGTINAPVDLGEFYPDDINNHGVMAGRYQGFMSIAWFDGNEELQVMQCNASQRYFGPRVEAINDFPIGDSRLIVVGRSRRNEEGDYDADDSYRGIAWRPFDAANETTVIGTFGGYSSWAKDVNDAGQIVGWADTRRNGERAFIYEGGQTRKLNDLCDSGEAELRWANGINNNGDIVGWMRIPRPISEQRAFLLRPNN